MGNSGSLATATPVVPVTGATAVPTINTSGCDQPLDVGAAGPMVSLFINNKAGSPIDVTMGLPRANSLGQCGFAVLGPIQPDHTLKVALPENRIALGDACYWAYAVITNQGRQSIVSGSGFCLDVTRTWTLNVHTDRLRLVTP